jgi:MFS family permease
MSTTSVIHDHKIVKRNIAAGAANSFFVEAAMTTSEPGTVLTLFIRELTGSTFLAGLVPSLRYFGWLAPQFLAAGHMQRLRRFLPTVQALEAVRSIGYMLAAAAIAFLSRSHPELVVILFATVFMATRIAAGCSAVARNEIIARIVPEDQRAGILSIRRITGGIAGLLAGFLISYVLDERTASFPGNYALLMLISGISFALAIASLSVVVEPDLPIRQQSRSMGEQIKQAPLLLRRDRRYALYIGVRLCSAGMTLAMPFFILFATDVLGAPASLAGFFISARTLFRILSNAYWGRRCQDAGSASVLTAGAGLGVLAPLLVVVFAGVVGLLGGGTPPLWLAWAFGLVFILQGLAGAAEGLGQIAYLYDIAPPEDRPSYYGLANTLLGPLYFLPAVGGALIDLVGYVPIFVIAALMMTMAFMLSMRLEAQDVGTEQEGSMRIPEQGA